MMIKKSMLLIVMASACQLLLYACCDNVHIIYDITGLNVFNYNSVGEAPDSSVVSSEEFFLKFYYDQEAYVSSPAISGFTNSVYAFSCPPNSITINSALTDFILTCDRSILDYDAGDTIRYNDILIIHEAGNPQDTTQFRSTVEEWMSSINLLESEVQRTWNIKFKRSFQSNEYLRFSLYLVQQDGTLTSDQSGAILVQ